MGGAELAQGRGGLDQALVAVLGLLCAVLPLADRAPRRPRCCGPPLASSCRTAASAWIGDQYSCRLRRWRRRCSPLPALGSADPASKGRKGIGRRAWAAIAPGTGSTCCGRNSSQHPQGFPATRRSIAATTALGPGASCWAAGCDQAGAVHALGRCGGKRVYGRWWAAPRRVWRMCALGCAPPDPGRSRPRNAPVLRSPAGLLAGRGFEVGVDSVATNRTLAVGSPGKGRIGCYRAASRGWDWGGRLRVKRWA